MTKRTRAELIQRVIFGARAYGISNVLFRHAMAQRLDLNVTDLECLGLLFMRGISSPTELASHTGLTSGAATAMLDRLERAGLIERRPNPGDRRGTRIVLRQAGTDRVAPWFTAVRTSQNELVSSYTEAELQIVLDFLERSAFILDEARAQLPDGSRPD